MFRAVKNIAGTFLQPMGIQMNIWLLLFGGLQGLLLSFVLVKKRPYREGYGFLLAYLLVLMAQLLFKVADKHWLMQEVRTSYFLSYKFPLLYGPLVWLFVQRLTGASKTFSLRDFLHFLPFVYSLAILIIEFHIRSTGWLYWPLETGPGLILQLASLSVYHWRALRLWRRHHHKMTGYFSELHVFKTQWIKTFLSYSLVVCVAISVLTFFIYVWYPAHNWLRFGFVLLAVFIYWISYSAMRQPQLFTGFGVDKSPTVSFPPSLVVHRPAKKYAHSSLSDEEAGQIVARLGSLMQDQKLFAQPELTIDELAARLSTTRYVLSQVLNERLTQSFYEYINGCRVDAAKAMLVDEAFANHKIAAIGYEAGFNSLSTFNEVFKKLTGRTPSGFKKGSAEEGRKQRI